MDDPHSSTEDFLIWNATEQGLKQMNKWIPIIYVEINFKSIRF